MPFFKLNHVFADRYHFTALIGEGASAEVWLADDCLLAQEQVILKMYAPGKGKREAGIEQYREEYLRSQQLAHPHLVKILHFGVSEGIPYLVMPFYPLGTLDLLKEATFSERQVALVMSQIGSALAALHSQDPPVLNQQVRPENIVLSDSDCYLLADFGISSLPTQTDPKNTGGSKTITTAYAPPESFDRFLKMGPSGDIFSLGVSLFAMCTKTLPWGGGGGQSLLTERLIGQLPKTYSFELNELLHACMSLNSFERPGAEELHLRGKRFLETGHWSLHEKEKEESRPFKKTKPYPLAAVGAVLLIAVGYFAYIQNQQAATLEKQPQIDATFEIGDGHETEAKMLTLLEAEKDYYVKRTRELEKENQELLRKDSVNTLLLENRHATDQKQLSLAQAPTSSSRKKNRAKTIVTSLPSAKPAKKGNLFLLPAELEQYLNKISDPALPEQERITWKQRVLDQFSEDAIRIFDETAEGVRQYSPNIFLNLLLNVPHTVVVKQLKRDRNQEVTELRLSMQAKM